VASVLSFVVLTPVRPAGAAQVLRIDLGTFGEPNSGATSMNDRGWVAGYSQDLFPAVCAVSFGRLPAR
jgi:hypothetical protein